MSESLDINFGDVLRRSWEIFTANALELVLGYSLASLSMLLLITVGPAALGMFATALDAARGKPITVGSSFRGYSHFLSGLGLATLTGLAIILAFPFFIIPAVLLGIVLSWSNFCLWDAGGSGAVSAMKESVRLAKAHFGPTLLALVIIGLMNTAGSLMALLGLIVSVPMSIIFAALVYDELRAADARAVN